MINANVRLIFDRKGVTQGDKDTPALLQVEIRLIGGSRRIFITTSKYVTKNQYTYKNGNFVCKGHPDEDVITTHVRTMLRKITAFISSDKCKKLDDVKNYDSPDICTDEVVPFIKKEMQARGLRIGTIKQHLSLVNKIEEYGKIVTFEDLTYNNIDAFDKHMRQNTIEDVTLHKRHTTLSSYLKEAVRKGLLRQNPYDVFKPKRGKSKDPVFLTDLELRRIEDWDPTTDKMAKVKDLFLFQCYTGMAYSDMSKFDKSEIYKEGDYDVIRSSRTKTDERFVTLLLPEAKNILEKYSYDLPLMSNQKYNDYLKVLMTFAQINKSATSHTARHTYAVFLLNKGVPIEAVSVALGHTNIKQTQHYAKLSAKTTIQAVASKLLVDDKKKAEK